jgi:hypothetical protein
VHVSPRSSVCGGSPIERGFGRSEATKPDGKGNNPAGPNAKLINATSMRARARASWVDAVLWRRPSEAAVAHRPKRIGNEGRCRSNNGYPAGPNHASLRRNAITSDAVLWRRPSEAAVAHRPKRIGNEGRCRSNNGSIRLTTETEARPSFPVEALWPGGRLCTLFFAGFCCRLSASRRHDALT